ncbi:MAG: DUF58 domain-containing protein [Candidatus Dormibacteria bacterium]
MTTRVPLLACIAVLSFFAGVTGVRLAYTLTYILVTLLVIAYIWSWTVTRRLMIGRAPPQGHFAVGEAFSDRLLVRNGSPLPIPYCELGDAGAVPGHHPGRACALAAGETLTWTATGAFTHRGLHRFGPLQARLGDPFGLFPRVVRGGQTGEVLVHPAIHPIEALPGSDGRAGDTRRGRGRESAPDASSIREHDPGDGLNRIHWPSSARTGRLMSRTFESPDSGDLLVILDLQSGVHAGVPPESSLEYSVSLAASLCHAALRRGQAVGLVASDAAGTAFPAGRGEAQRLRLLEYLAIARDDGNTPLADAVARHGPSLKGRGGLVVVTSRCDASWVEALLDVGARGRRHLCVFVDATSFGAPGPALRLTAAWRLVLDWWVVRRGDVIETTRAARAAGL